MKPGIAVKEAFEIILGEGCGQQYRIEFEMSFKIKSDAAFPITDPPIEAKLWMMLFILVLKYILRLNKDIP